MCEVTVSMCHAFASESVSDFSVGFKRGQDMTQSRNSLQDRMTVPRAAVLRVKNLNRSKTKGG